MINESVPALLGVQPQTRIERVSFEILILCRCKPKTNNLRSRKCRNASKLKNSLVECLKDPQVKNTKTLQLLKRQTETLLSKKRKKILIVVDRSVSIEMLAAGNKWRLMLTTCSKEN